MLVNGTSEAIQWSRLEALPRERVPLLNKQRAARILYGAGGEPGSQVVERDASNCGEKVETENSIKFSSSEKERRTARVKASGQGESPAPVAAAAAAWAAASE